MSTKRMSVGIVGAGIAGLRCAEVLAEGGASVRLFDKGRSPGGRMSTRRAAGTSFDHGAQFMTGRSAEFGARLRAWADAGVAAPWTGRFAEVPVAGQQLQPAHPRSRWVGTPTMSAVPKAMAAAMDVRCSTRVLAVTRESGGWRLREDDGHELGLFERVVINVPAGQAEPLLDGVPRLRTRAEQASFQPCWAAMIIPKPPFDPGFDGLRVGTGPLAWAGRQASKPGRDAVPGWVLHADGEWTQAHFDAEPGWVLQRLCAALAEVSAQPVEPLRHARAHRWRYARAAAKGEAGYLYDEGAGVGACGDWCSGPRVEHAYLSGQALGRRLLQDG